MGQEAEAVTSSAPKACEMMRNHVVNSISLEERDRGQRTFMTALAFPSESPFREESDRGSAC